jgi:inosine-uridine nucleoside N-ribohydrolase
MAQHIARIVPFYKEFYAKYDVDGIFVHDPSTIAYLIDPSLFTVKQYPIRVDTNHSISRGKTWPRVYPEDEGAIRYPAWKNRPLVNVCVAVNAQGVIDLELARIRA